MSFSDHFIIFLQLLSQLQHERNLYFPNPDQAIKIIEILEMIKMITTLVEPVTKLIVKPSQHDRL